MYINHHYNNHRYLLNLIHNYHFLNHHHHHHYHCLLNLIHNYYFLNYHQIQHHYYIILINIIINNQIYVFIKNISKYNHM